MNNNAFERIKRLRNKTLLSNLPSFRSDEGKLLWGRGWFKDFWTGSNIFKRAYAKANIRRALWINVSQYSTAIIK